MGNCQAAEAATVVIQHPSGRIERLYWPTPAQDIMKANPGHHVALVTLCIAQEKPEAAAAGAGHVRFTRVRLLKPKDMLLIGQVYRLITSQEVSKALKTRKHEKMKKTQDELMKKQRQLIIAQNTRVDPNTEAHGQGEAQAEAAERIKDQAEKQERDRQKSTGANPGGARGRHWRPTLQSISEVVI